LQGYCGIGFLIDVSRPFHQKLGESRQVDEKSSMDTPNTCINTRGDSAKSMKLLSPFSLPLSSLESMPSRFIPKVDLVIFELLPSVLIATANPV
jgi:hypothetical protein